MTVMTKQFDRHIESVLAALEVMDSFLEESKLSIKDLVELTGMTRNRISRILGTLIHKGYVMEAAEKGMYTPGPKLLALGNVFETNQSLVVLVRSVLRQLALKTGESATFYVREGMDRVVLAREEGTNAIRFAVSVGQRLDLHAGAAGKVLLAFAPEKEKNIILSRLTLEEITPHTLTDPGRLRDELAAIRATGYSISRGERDPDAFALAAPVFERNDKLIGALSIAGPLSRLNTEGTEKGYVNELLLSAASLSRKFCTVRD